MSLELDFAYIKRRAGRGRRRGVWLAVGPGLLRVRATTHSCGMAYVRDTADLVRLVGGGLQLCDLCGFRLSVALCRRAPP